MIYGYMPYLYTIDFTPEKEFHDIAIRSIFRQLLSISDHKLRPWP